MRRVVFGPIVAVAAFLVGVAAVMCFSILTFEPAAEEAAVPEPGPVRVIEGTETLEYWIPSPSHCEDEDDLAVYRAILSGPRYSGSKIVVEEMSGRGGSIVYDMLNKEQVKGTSAMAIRNFKRWNLAPESLRWIGEISPRIEFLSSEEEGQIFIGDMPGEGWSRFYQRYPGSGGLVSLSRIGFNDDHTEALVYVAHTCGSLCGSGEFVILKKDHGRWTIDRTDTMWVS